MNTTPGNLVSLSPSYESFGSAMAEEGRGGGEAHVIYSIACVVDTHGKSLAAAGERHLRYAMMVHALLEQSSALLSKCSA